VSIARTEALRAVSMGEYESLVQAKQQGKLDINLVRFWNYVPDERTRANHREIPKMNSEGVAVDVPFQTPLGALRFPRDPNGIAENVINCRCFLTYDVVEGVKNALFIQ